MVKENISLEISLLLLTFGRNVVLKSRNRKTTLQEAMLHRGHLFAYEIGSQTDHGLTEKPKKVKISFKNSWAIFFSFHADALLEGFPLNTLSRNEQMLLGIWEDADLGERVHRFNSIV